ncbi:hypothetical protein ABIB49_000200 [Arthrobacter sp. UYCu512]|uniref:hypothetical protein n=1 Tax=Arthrobacter sp. UYCu512 TaxID=3156338 RepID=UPI0033959A8D
MRQRPSPAGLVAGVFFLVWAAIFLAWTPVETLRLVTGIIFVPIGVAVIAKYFIGRRPRTSSVLRHQPMTTKTRVLRNLAVYAAGFLPFALLWRSIGVVPSVLMGAAAVAVVAAIFRRHEAKSRQS